MRKPLRTKKEPLPFIPRSTHSQLTHTGHNLRRSPFTAAQMMCNPSLNMTGKRLWYWDKDWGVEQWCEIQCLHRPSSNVSRVSWSEHMVICFGQYSFIYSSTNYFRPLFRCIRHHERTRASVRLCKTTFVWKRSTGWIKNTSTIFDVFRWLL